MKQALLIIDIQNDYFKNGAMELVGSEEASLIARKLLDKFREENLPIIHIQHISTRAGATFFLPNTFGAEIHENVRPKENEKIIIKNFPNSFRDTDLLEYLKSENISDLVVCGMMTHLCVDTTVRAAKDLGFDITLIADAVATKDLEIFGKRVYASEVNLSFLAALNYFFSNVITFVDYLKE